MCRFISAVLRTVHKGCGGLAPNLAVRVRSQAHRTLVASVCHLTEIDPLLPVIDVRYPGVPRFLG